MIVDDDRDHAESVAEILEMRGHQVELAYTGEEAIVRFRKADFDIVFMDVKLPRMNGVQTFLEFKRVRSEARVVMMTGYSVEQLVAQAVDNGALGVLRKPFNAADLLMAVDNVKPRGIVLIADDDPLFTCSIMSVLSGHGYRVETAGTGEEALQKLSHGAIDCLLLDVRMPVLSGLEVYLRLKEANRLVPTILITGHACDDETNQLRLMTQGLLIKPFDPAVLLRAMDDLNLSAEHHAR